MAHIENDKYYTPVSLANRCWEMTIKALGTDSFSEIIEPSVGSGSFLQYDKLTPLFAYDIAPECVSNEGTTVITGDFLEQEIGYLPGRLTIGNPPYGRCMYKAQAFYKKATEIGDYVAFILPISQLNNTRSLYAFDLILSENLGVQNYSGKELHCCFNVYKRPESGELNKQPTAKLKDITIYRQDKKGYSELPYDIRMCYWGNGSAGKILKDGEHYSAEYKIKINNTEQKDEIIRVLTEFDWSAYLNCIAMRKIQQFHIVDVLRKEVEGIE